MLGSRLRANLSGRRPPAVSEPPWTGEDAVMEIIAHPPRRARGLGHVERAIALGADRVELDVLTLDGELVIAHDHGQARRGRAPALEEGLALVAAASCGVLADLKDPAAAVGLTNALTAAGLQARAVVSGGLDEVNLAAGGVRGARLLRAWTLPTDRGAQPGAAAGPLGLGTATARRRVRAAAETALREGRCDGVCVDRRFVSPGLADAVHDAGGRLLVWTVDHPAEVRRFAGLGIDALITHDPAGARRALAA